MRKIQNIAFVLLATLFAGCINDHIENTLCRDGVLSLNLSTGATTRTDTPNNGVGEGDNDNKIPTESAIKDIQFFLYPKGSADTVNASFAGIIDVTATDRTEQTVTVPADVISKLCPNPGDKCDIYVIVNYLNQEGEDLTDDAETSRARLKRLPLTTEFYYLDIDLPVGPESFVMDSEVFSVTRGTGDDSNKLVSETIYVTRAAAKIMLEVNLQTTVDVSGVQWQPVTEVPDANQYFARVSFYNGVKEGVIDDNSDTEPTGKDIADSASSTPYYHAENMELIPGGISTDITDPATSSVTRASSKAFTHDAGLYSYTSSWGDDEEDAPYFKLSIPWRKVVDGQDGNAAWVTYDYTVPISLKTNQLVRNKLYLIRLNVGALGDLDYLDPAVYSYVVLDWEDVSMNAELSRPQYLVVDTNKVVMNNIEEVRVGYQSSDAVSVEVLSSTIGGTYAVYETYNAYIDTATHEIVLEHQLDNVHDSIDKIYDYLPQTVVVKIYHTDNPDMYEEIEFVQYPAMYVTWEPLSRSTVFVNANSSRSQGWWWVRGSASASANMYTVTVSAFDSSTAEYIIADPREPANNDNFVFRQDINANSAVRATGEDASGDNTLTGYRGAITGDVSEYLIAPQMLFSSSYISNGENSVNTYNYLTNGKYRCAGYQENGYPAGRWRLPTPAEILYVGRLGAEKKVEGIFVNNVVYLSSNGGYRYLENNGGSVTREGDTSATLRCVYDLWYWKDKCADVTKFIWGADGDNLEQKREKGLLVPIE